MHRRDFILGAGAVAVSASPAFACVKAVLCGSEVPNVNFGAGTVNRSPDFTLDFCLPDEIWASISKGREETPWILRLMTFDSDGQVRWHRARTVTEGQCRRQGVYTDTTVASYITCMEYTGWISTGPITSGAKPTFRRVNWNMRWQDLDRRFPSI